MKIKGIFTDSNNIFLWHKSDDIIKDIVIPKISVDSNFCFTSYAWLCARGRAWLLNCAFDISAIIWSARYMHVSAAKKYALICGSKVLLWPRVFFVSKTQEIVVEKVMEIVQMLDISIYLLIYSIKQGWRYVMKEKKITLIGFSDM